MSYQLINIADATQNIACPYCQHAVLDWDQEQYIQPCEHTLFMAMDLGFEFIADRFDEVLSQSVDEIHEDPNMNIFATVSQANYPEMQIYKADLGVEGLFRYVGFSQN
ncbi:hypothetical protein EC846_0708 [Acinetobacter sp. BIGb0102]|jgi:uncharacterized protein YbaR (Trm112 family)|uniref:Uncharacterized protein n=1 Tax=Acinetobacter vivianii TaxID=1776742 RepID=N8W8M3_9GAMM|nr:MULTISPECIES: hypothetical protein [Acinetobacter]ENU91687.1 hypothetical protein F971_02779 [Acinetobacter vivianii]ENX22717.1 hypothetical protein F892_01959 [Acinetobacter vivianii]KYQ83326.1 hypothetical protein AWW72_14380 [Acinetobacter sp. NRRL B-65365]RPE31246.1 hypothetical protein EC846_0708 [Acinetobacter sp. BIGb0102]GGI59086.1 hypothetical protein GCM10011446_05810 [Acinetobacter vivianii]